MGRHGHLRLTASTFLVPHDFDRRILGQWSHRPWPLPDRPWVMTQTWHDLLFAHWPVPSKNLAPLVPAAFELDMFENQAWVAVVPFRMTNVAPRGVPAPAWLSAFPEANVRTYVRVEDKPGVYFFSLDAASAPAVRAARWLFNLPYYLASMTVAARAGGVDYRSRRIASPAAELAVSYQPIGPVFEPRRDSLEYFLTERYCLYALHRSGRPYRLDIHHPPWPLQEARAEFTKNTMVELSGMTLPSVTPLLHFARRQDIVAWAPTSVAPPRD
jgi:uncharacterized protein YqjF (DUF2071 family)